VSQEEHRLPLAERSTPPAGGQLSALVGHSGTRADLSIDGDFEQRRFALQSLIVLSFVSGVAALATVASVHLDESDRTGVLVVAGIDLLVATIAFAWRRAEWGRHTLLLMVVPALAIFSYGNYVDADPYRAGSYMFVIAVWIGISQPRFVNVALTPLYAVAYWLPLWLHPHGSTFDQSVLSVVVVAVASGETVAWLTSRLAALSDRLSVEAGEQLEASEESFRLLFQRSPLPKMVFDPVGLRCLRANDAACTLYGYSLDEVLRMRLPDLLPGTEPDGPVAGGDPPPGGYLRPGLWQHETKDGRRIDVEIAVNRLPLEGIDASVVVIVDVTKQRALEDQLRYFAIHDPITGLANRALLQDRLAQALAASTRRAQSVAVLFCDIGGFAAINEGLGHDVGDRVLQEVASRLNDVVRPGDTVARYGSQEFAVVVELTDRQDAAEALADRIIAAVTLPFGWDGKQVQLSVSIGIAFGDSTVGADELCRSAVAAARQAEVAGTSCCRVFEPAMRFQAQRRLELTSDLRAGLNEGQFRLQYQPHVALASGRLKGFEALVRWAHPTRGMIPPLDFIPIAEESGLIVPLGRWILETACHEATTWPRSGPEPLTIAVNLSVRQLHSASIVDDVRTALALSGLDPARLVLEITESVLMEDTAGTVALVEQLKALGVRLAIDDFGTGYSSLGYLHRFKFDVLKIDKSFVDALKDHPVRSSAFIRTIVTLGHTLGMQIITEGIETPLQFRELKRLGSDAGQGYLMSRPLDPRAVLTFVERPATDYSLSEQWT
jgi:diguanylate cyclase (GGDEF)-like protein/PAS domain S-box-containing protein